MSVKFNFPKIARESGFKLQQFRDGPLDWQFIGSLEVDKILHKQQFEHIDAILLHLSEAPLAFLLDSNILDSGMTKFYILSQFAIQYLIFCRKFLDGTVRTLRSSLIEMETENTNLKTINRQNSNEIVNLQKKISQIEAINEIIFPCHVCTKNFVSNDALNLHLSKKHLKTTTADIQETDNDRTLINTIKLELEVKQLKERLNIAEKDIRETVESKKTSPREVPKISKSTQIDTMTKNTATQIELVKNQTASRDIGLQSNLYETKENDCTEPIETKSGLHFDKENELIDNVKVIKNEVLTKLQDKITDLENWQKSNNSHNQQSIKEITQTLNEIKESLESRKEEDVKSLTQIAKDAILSSIPTNEMPAMSTDELHRILSSMFSEVLHANSHKLDDLLIRIEKTCEEKIASLEVDVERKGMQFAKTLDSRFNMTDNSIRLQQSKEHILSSTHSARTYSVEISQNEISSDAQLNESSNPSSQSEESVEIQSSPKNTILKDLSIEKDLAIQKYSQKMSLYGLTSNTEGLSVGEAATISSHLSENRNSLKKVYPRFYATRNRLAKFVNAMSNNMKPNAKPKQKQDNKNINKTQMKKNRLSTIPSDLKNSDFKQRLETILRSPINKPSNYILSTSKEQTKPSPMPRRQVMFYNQSNEEISNK